MRLWPCLLPQQIAVVSGLKEAGTGDLLVSGDIKHLNLLPPSLRVPDPVLYATVEAGSVSQEKVLEQALREVAREDPSLRVTFGDDTNKADSSTQFHTNRDQIVVAGMGELHLEIVMDRIRKEYKVDADMGSLSVAYKETVTGGNTRCGH